MSKTMQAIRDGMAEASERTLLRTAAALVRAEAEIKEALAQDDAEAGYGTVREHLEEVAKVLRRRIDDTHWEIAILAKLKAEPARGAA